MHVVWKFGLLAITAEEVDFRDPAGTGPDVRERGLRIEFRVVDDHHEGSIYASDRWTVRPAFCRLDLLESGPGRADRIHWHPDVRDGEPGDRVFDTALTADPVAWIRERLQDLPAFLRRTGEPDLEVEQEDLNAELEGVLAWIEHALDHSRRPWPVATHDERGLAATR
ncbi:hypothetical protein OOZ19_16200 [Saccharopolyspora sp. NFXS83]|uniref:hypothetical protein n=1 Tax=Saccharopolyspora sp. NFXS83 TaxID=2993560 RepID=UPI00224B5C8D|nr:hypothetical protein [Saccharopolyspora sp. NFXS83]MCX2731785.1 hypothetical protein [Saccharopolyspora sp. NFXS83]